MVPQPKCRYSFLFSEFLIIGPVPVVTNALFICRVEKGVETSIYMKEFAVIGILDRKGVMNDFSVIRPHHSTWAVSALVGCGDVFC